MAGHYSTFIVEWRCLKPDVYGEEHGYTEEIGRSSYEVESIFKEINPDYEVINVKFKKEE